MDSVLEQLKILLDESRLFDYSALPKGGYGYPLYIPSDLNRWVYRSEQVVAKNFQETSSICKLMKLGVLGLRSVVGNGEDEFLHMKGQIVSALESAVAAVTNDVFGEVKIRQTAGAVCAGKSNKVFIVHGHDHKEKNELEIFIREIGLDPVVLHREADGGKTIIEKFLHNSDVGYALIIATPDDVVSDGAHQPRQNVIFEWGFFLGKLGRERVCCLFKQGTKLPSDLSGLIYKQFINSIEEVKFAVIKELKAAGYSVSFDG